MKRIAYRWVLVLTVVATGAGCASWALAQEAPTEDNIRPAFTLPYKSYNVHFPTLGVIKDVMVKEGDVIKKGDALMKQDDSEEAAELKVMEAAILQSEQGLKVGEAKLRVTQYEYEAKDKLNKVNGGMIELEVKRTEAERDVAAAQLEQARRELDQTKARRDKQRIHVENMTLKASTAGIVKDLVGDVGSNTDPTRPVLTVVENNPLLVEVQVPALASLQLKKGDKLRVSYDKTKWREASVSFLSPQADAGAGIRIIRLEMPNPDGEPSGLQAFVELPSKLLAAAGGK